ncbi:MAG: hypothetical protein ACQEWW_26320 [Bacillota bacterium]
MKKLFFLGVFSVFLILAACGSEDTFSDMTTEDFKEFVSEKESGFIFIGFDKEKLEANKEQISKALDENGLESNFFNYQEHVSNEQSRTFRSDIGTEQLKDTLGYYEDGVLMAEFEMPNKWNDKKMEDLNKFVVQISE